MFLQSQKGCNEFHSLHSSIYNAQVDQSEVFFGQVDFKKLSVGTVYKFYQCEDSERLFIADAI